MYLGHGETNFSKFTIYSLSRDLIDRHSIDVGLFVDFGSRHGESLDELGPVVAPAADFVFVEPAPRCVSIIRDRIAAEGAQHDLRFNLIDAVIGATPGALQLHTFESDDDQSANAFTDRSGRYGASTVVEVPVVSYDVFDRFYPGRDIDFAKVNIEGWEYGMIADGFFQRKVRAFVMELHNQHVDGKTWADAVRGLESSFDIMTHGDLNHKYCFMSGVRCG